MVSQVLFSNTQVHFTVHGLEKGTEDSALPGECIFLHDLFRILANALEEVI